ncbi:MAG: hypothetical protein QXG39_00380 [Candidatus Aenigmatarchaeota archaeon]
MKSKNEREKNFSLHTPLTKLTEKHSSPLIIRRYSEPILTFVGIISDDNLDGLDFVVKTFFTENEIQNSIQGLRNLAGKLCEKIKETFLRVEGVAVVMYADKMVISSLSGDFMNCEMCRKELYDLLNFMTKV